MSGFTDWQRCAAALLCAVMIAPESHAASLTVFPVRVMLSDEEPVQTVTVRNGGNDTARMQLRFYTWSQDANGEDVFAETRDVLANPALFEIGPKQDQIVRLGLRIGQGVAESSYRIFLEEVPQGPISRPGKIRALLRISLPVFVAPLAPLGQMRWQVAGNGRQVTVIAQNASNEHVQIMRLALAREDGSVVGQREMSDYLLPGTSRRIAFELSTPVTHGEAIRLRALTDHGPLAAEIVSGAPRSERARP